VNFSEIVSFIGEDVLRDVFSSQLKCIRFASSRHESMNLLKIFFQKVVEIYAKCILDGHGKKEASKLVKTLDNITFNIYFEASSQKNYACDFDLTRYR
jgi:hypothetical protein